MSTVASLIADNLTFPLTVPRKPRKPRTTPNLDLRRGIRTPTTREGVRTRSNAGCGGEVERPGGRAGKTSAGSAGPTVHGANVAGFWRELVVFRSVQERIAAWGRSAWTMCSPRLCIWTLFSSAFNACLGKEEKDIREHKE